MAVTESVRCGGCAPQHVRQQRAHGVARNARALEGDRHLVRLQLALRRRGPTRGVSRCSCEQRRLAWQRRRATTPVPPSTQRPKRRPPAHRRRGAQQLEAERLHVRLAEAWQRRADVARRQLRATGFVRRAGAASARHAHERQRSSERVVRACFEFSRFSRSGVSRVGSGAISPPTRRAGRLRAWPREGGRTESVAGAMRGANMLRGKRCEENGLDTNGRAPKSSRWAAGACSSPPGRSPARPAGCVVAAAAAKGPSARCRTELGTACAACRSRCRRRSRAGRSAARVRAAHGSLTRAESE